MLRTYRALLHGDRIEWIERPTIPPHAVPVHVTLLEDEIVEAAVGRGPAMAAALEALAGAGGLATIADPAGWQREQRQDRRLPGREG